MTNLVSLILAQGSVVIGVLGTLGMQGQTQEEFAVGSLVISVMLAIVSGIIYLIGRAFDKDE